MGIDFEKRYFLATVRTGPYGIHDTWKRLECLKCGWSVGDAAQADVARARTVSDAIISHVCNADDSHWREVVRDAFLSGDDHRAITIIETMEPNKLSYTTEIGQLHGALQKAALQIGQLRHALKEVIGHVEAHNTAYARNFGNGHVVSVADIERWKKIGGYGQRIPPNGDPANHPDSPELLLDLGKGLPYTTTKDRFHELLVIVAGQDAAVLWNRDVAPLLEPGEAPWSMHDGGDGNAVLNSVRTCVRVYLHHHAAAWHRVHKRWYVVKADGSNGHQTAALINLFQSQLDRGGA